jgi:hypothetical protein
MTYNSAQFPSSSNPGTNTFLRSPQIAARAFGTNNTGQLMTAVPRIKFNFFAKFTLGSGAISMLPTGANLDSYNDKRGLSFKVKTADKPKVTMVTEELNQYNKKVLAYKKVEYQEATIRLHDTVDDSILSTWIDYFTYYFADSRNKNPSDYTQSPVSAEFADSSGWGFRPLVENTRFFDKITIYALFAGTYTSFSYINPKITSIDWAQKDYSSSDPEEVIISFKYEAIQYEAIASPTNSGSTPNIDNFGFNLNQDGFNPDISNFMASSLINTQPNIFNASPATPTTLSTDSSTGSLSSPTGNTPNQIVMDAIRFAGIAPGALLPAIQSVSGSLGGSINPASFGNILASIV